MDLIEQLTRDEGLRLFPYVDTAGKTSIGVGRNLTDVGISQAESDVLLQNDIASATAKLERLYPWFSALDPVRQAVLINMTFNMGSISSFPRMLALVQAGDYAGAAAEMLDSLWARQVGDRAQRLSQQMQTGEWV